MREVQLVHFLSFLCFGSAAAMFGDGGSGVESILRIVKALCINEINGVLCKLKHIFPNTYQRIKGICSPAKVGTGCYRF